MSSAPQDRDDQAWLDALAGKTRPATGTAADTQAALLRKALLARSARLDEQVPPADPALYEQIRFRLRREGLARQSAWRRPAIWGLAASLMLGVALVLQVAAPLKEENGHGTLRGGADATVLIHPDPESRMVALVGLLKAAGAEPMVERVGNGRIVLRVHATQRVLDALSAQRIEPTIKDGAIALIIAPTSKKP